MFRKLLNWFAGYVLVYIKGYSIERFINVCRSKEIHVWEVKSVEGGYTFYMKLRDYKELRPIARKTRLLPLIRSKCGFPFYLQQYGKRKGLFLGLFMFLAILYTLSLFIWDIGIEGGYKYTRETLLKFLNQTDVYTGMMKKNVDCTRIEEKIRLKYKDISWVSAEVKGTRLIIKITETNMPTTKRETREPSHMVATKDGIVTSMITRYGVPQVKIGDVVKKGDILISGIVQVKGDFDAYINTKTVVADADITCKTYYEYSDTFSRNYMKKNYTGKKKKGLILNLFNKKISLHKPRISYKNYDIITDEAVLKLSWDFYLPFRALNLEYLEYDSVEQTYTEEEAEQIAMQHLKEYLDVLDEHNVKLIDNQVKIVVDDNKCTAMGKIIVEESCWEYKQIEENEWRNSETDELDGDNH